MFLITPLSFDALSPMNPPRISAQTLYWQKLESFGYIFVADSIDLIFIQIFKVSSERRMCFETERIMTLQGHPRSLILAPTESLCMTSYLTSIVTLVLSCRVSEILELLYPRKPLFQHPTPIRAKIPRCFPWSRPVMFGLQRANIPG